MVHDKATKSMPDNEELPRPKECNFGYKIPGTMYIFLNDPERGFSEISSFKSCLHPCKASSSSQEPGTLISQSTSSSSCSGCPGVHDLIDAANRNAPCEPRQFRLSET